MCLGDLHPGGVELSRELSRRLVGEIVLSVIHDPKAQPVARYGARRSNERWDLRGPPARREPRSRRDRWRRTTRSSAVGVHHPRQLAARLDEAVAHPVDVAVVETHGRERNSPGRHIAFALPRGANSSRPLFGIAYLLRLPADVSAPCDVVVPDAAPRVVVFVKMPPISEDAFARNAWRRSSAHPAGNCPAESPRYSVCRGVSCVTVRADGGPRASGAQGRLRGRRCRDVCVDTFSRRAVYCVALRGRRRL